jgi:hypothetical protein
MDNKLSFAEALANIKPETVIVKAPSGLFYERIKPTAVASIFDLAELPQSAASAAKEEWLKQGVGTLDADDADGTKSEEVESKNVKKAIEIRNRVCSNSVNPKITMSENPAPEEFHWSRIPAKDLEFLFQYETARGDASAMLAMFSERPESSPFLGSHSKKQRKAGK